MKKVQSTKKTVIYWRKRAKSEACVVLELVKEVIYKSGVSVEVKRRATRLEVAGI